jgi:soluble lytic murein transglycosylase-like protein
MAKRALYEALAGIAVAALMFLSGVVFEFNTDTKSQRAITASERTRVATEKRILTWIVETNPQATIRDFADFPRYLLDAAAERGLDYRLLLAMAAHESGMRPDVVGGAGEIGLFQILPRTAELVAKSLKLNFKPPTRGTTKTYADLGSLGDPKINALIAAEYFKQQVDRFGQTPTALQAYNRGDARAREDWPKDRYAADVAKVYMVLAADRQL